MGRRAIPRTWELSEHSDGKHIVLRSYLNAWVPILGSANGRLVIIDGYAGPGRYKAGEPGSPLIALDAINSRHSPRSLRDVYLIACEADPGIREHLRSVLATVDHGKASVEVVPGTFQDSVGELLDSVASKNQRLVPTFALLDPLGVKGLRLELIETLFRVSQADVLVSFMWEPIRRWMDHPDWEEHLDALFGSDAWRDYRGLSSLTQKRKMHDLYADSLRRAGARFVVPLEIWSRRPKRHVYTMFFATRHIKGVDVFKQGAWKCDPTGNFRFSARAGGQRTLFDENRVDLGPLREALIKKFSGTKVSVEQVSEFVVGETLYHSGHFKKGVLKVLENEGLIKCERRQRAGTYPPGTLIRFA